MPLLFIRLESRKREGRCVKIATLIVRQSSNELYHHGVKGQKWGVRRYQNREGGYLPGAEGRYYTPVGGRRGKISSSSKNTSTSYDSGHASTKSSSSSYDEKAARMAKIKKYAKVGAAVVGVGLVGYGAYKLRSHQVAQTMRYKRDVDTILKKGTTLSTLSYDADRTKGADMFFATHTKLDQHQYNALFNKPIKEYIKDEAGNNVGSRVLTKFRIKNEVLSDMKVASETSAAKHFADLLSKDSDLRSFVLDPGRMEDHFVDSKYKFKGYREAKEALDRVRQPDYKPTQDDWQKVYRMFNYVIPSDGTKEGLSSDTIAARAKDVKAQREKFFSVMKKNGYGALLDTNDSMYGGFKATSPVIVFDQENIAFAGAKRTTRLSKIPSAWVLAGRRAMGL